MTLEITKRVRLANFSPIATAERLWTAIDIWRLRWSGPETEYLVVLDISSLFLSVPSSTFAHIVVSRRFAF